MEVLNSFYIFLRLANSANSFLTKLYYDWFRDIMLCESSESKVKLRGKFELFYNHRRNLSPYVAAHSP